MAIEEVTAEDVPTITRCLRLEVIKPIGDHTWESVGPHLHDLKFIAARLMNEGTIACLTSNKAPQSAAADGIHHGLTEIRSYYVKLAKTIPRSAEGDEYAKRERAVRISKIELPSVMIDAMTGQIKARFGRWRKQRFRANERFPSFTSGTLMVRDRGWELARDEKGLVLSLKLHPGIAPWISFAVRADGGSAHAQARLLVGKTPNLHRGDCKLVWDDDKRRWSVRLAFTVPKPIADKETDPCRVLSVHRGIRDFLTWATSTGKTGQASAWAGIKDPDTGVVKCAHANAIAALKNQMFKRRQGMRQHMKGSPRHRGRGWWRRFDNYRKAQDAEARFVETHCRQAAKEIVNKAVGLGCGTILLDDWSPRQAAAEIAKWEGPYAAWIVRRWPFGQLRDAIACAAESAGLRIVTVKADRESITCPLCRNIDIAQDNGRGRFTCTNPKCGFDRSSDAVANLNMFHAAGITGVLELQDAAVNPFVVAGKEVQRGTSASGTSGTNGASGTKKKTSKRGAAG